MVSLRMRVLKFGGTSVGSAKRIKDVSLICIDGMEKLVVVSAMSGTTNALLEISSLLSQKKLDEAKDSVSVLRLKYQNIVEELYGTDVFKEKAKEKVDEIFDYIETFIQKTFSISNGKIIAAQGEILSTNLLTFYLHEIGFSNTILLDALEFIKTDETGAPDQDFIKEKLTDILEKNTGAGIYVTQGFICKNFAGEIDNLGRNASDYTATLVGAAIHAEQIEIWTDIDGVHNGDPRVLRNTRSVPYLSYEEAGEMAYFGAKVLHSSCILPAKIEKIPVFLRNTMDPKAFGTLISSQTCKGILKAVASKDNITLISIESDRSLPSYLFMQHVFEAFSNHQVTIDLVLTSEVSVTVAVDCSSVVKPLDNLMDDLRNFSEVKINSGLVSVTIVGDVKNNSKDVYKRILDAIPDVPIHLITGGHSYSVSLVINSVYKKYVLENLHQSLFFTSILRKNICLVNL